MTGAITEDGTVRLEDYLMPEPPLPASPSGQTLDTSTLVELLDRLDTTKICAEHQPLGMLAREAIVRLYPDLNRAVSTTPDDGLKHLVETSARKEANYAKQRNLFPELDPSFLNMHITLEGFGNHGFLRRGEPIRVDVPRFSVYPVYEGNMFCMEFKESLTSRTLTFDNMDVRNNRYEIGRDLPEILKKHLFRSTQFITADNEEALLSNYQERGLHLSRKLREIYRRLRGTALVSTFNAIIPEETKKKIERAVQDYLRIQGRSIEQVEQGMHDFQRMYGVPFRNLTKDERQRLEEPVSRMMYFIAETKPEDWKQVPLDQIRPSPRYTVEPLAVLVVDNRMFLVDHFDTTPLENYVRKEFKM